ncbi:MAG TPA: PstS family phosphate ABC transporter substrate-binding protein [Thermodesulfobacteriota bacterium]|nr:PstS family phosphate ABC transporter substrate-binding protein [Thermodesulfobacteriota bacterium]
MKKMFLTMVTGLSLILTCSATSVLSASLIQVKGSDTEVNVVQMLAENFMKKNPNVSLAVTGGGSGVGIAAIINKTTDLANASRPMKKNEIENAKANGVDPMAVVFAVDGLSVILNPKNSVKTLTLDQIGQIYRGELTNWKQAGGPDLPVTLYGRQPNSGTFVFFREVVVRGDYANKMNQMNGNAQILEAVKKDAGGIGYVGIGYVVDDHGKVNPGIHVLEVAKDSRSKAYSPLKLENILKGLYPISRPLYQYFDNHNRAKVEGFIKYELSPEGVAIIQKEGFYPLTEEWKKYNAQFKF